uniref:ATP synthase complex subunit 8 n=1 Tax=Pseudoniphargus salinus TaxID=2211531 RepID=A0A345UEH4_9CRUS|nr:ATP synthase F0 subunit 8 [Pseudoniphargus salinus]
MPQMAPIMWLLLFTSFILLAYFLTNFLFFIHSPVKDNKTAHSLFSPLFHWKW